MYDFNPFREVKKYIEENKDNVNKSFEMVKAPLNKKRKYFEDLVKKGEMTQAEFDRYERLGEFEGAVFADTGEPDGNVSVKEGKSFEDMEDCIQFYMDAKDYDRKAAENECRNGRHTFSEAAEREYDDFDTGGQSDEDPKMAEYEAKEENDKYEQDAKNKVLKFVSKNPNDPTAKKVKHEIDRARVYSNPHEQNSCVVHVAGTSFTVPHHSDDVKVVS
jgi:hypothetical protein